MPANYPQERVGVAAIQSFAADRGQIWRETPNGDVGIDGQLEYVDASGAATGRTLAVQVKSGPSYFSHETQRGWKYYPAHKHLLYWERYPLPVVLVLHDPASRQSYWVDARQALRTPGGERASYIEVPKNNVLQSVSIEQLFMNAGVQLEVFIPNLNDVLKSLVEHYSNSSSLPISYFALFTQGLTNICRSLYFGMGLVMKAAEANLQMANAEHGPRLGKFEYDFLFNYIRFLVAQHLAEVDFADCLIDWRDREMMPAFIAPLTARGRQLVDAIGWREQEFVTSGDLPDTHGLHVAQEGFVEMVEMSYSPRLPLIFEFEAVFKAKLCAQSDTGSFKE
jgi:hypothetical protein